MISILNSLMEHPCASIFGDKIEPGIDFPPEYFEIIKKPMDIRTVISKIKNDEYKSLKECIDDIELVWNNAEKYYGRNSNITILANEVKNQFRRLFRPVSVRSVHGFCEEVYRLRTRIEKQIAASPYIEQSNESNALSEDKKSLIKQLTSEEEMQNLITAVELLTDKNDHLELKKIIEEKQPNLLLPGRKAVIMTTQLSPATFKEIKTFVKSALKKHGLEYPE